MQLAVKTLAAIEAALTADQGAKYRGLLRQLMPTAEDAYNEQEETFRSHLGASIIGRKCAREVWYSFRWCTDKKLEGRMIRLFNRGHLEEPRMIALLMLIGCEVWFKDENGKQFRIEGHRGHYGGGMDGVARGIPDLPSGVACLTEYKTHGEKSFNILIEAGVIKAKWEHFIQMQQYMGKNNLTHALYMATNKNTDHIHAEIIQYDPTQDKRYHDRAAMVIDSPKPLPKISESSAWFECNFCDQKPVCHGKELPVKTCRSCEFVRVEDNGKWSCSMKPLIGFLTKEQQLEACGLYKMIPSIKA